MRAVLPPGADIAALVRGSEADSLVVEVPPGGDPLALALACAAIGPLAVERAPRRVNAVLIGAAADPADVAAAVAFLHGAPSTTGQVLRVGQD